jgi:hypothetical protein
MYNEWSLDVFYKGADDPALELDMKKLEDCVGEYKSAVAALDASDATKTLRRVIDAKEEMGKLVRRLMGFFSLRRSANASDTAGAVYMTKIQGMMASLAKVNVAYNKFVGAIENIESVIAGDVFYYKNKDECDAEIEPNVARLIYHKCHSKGKGERQKAPVDNSFIPEKHESQGDCQNYNGKYEKEFKGGHQHERFDVYKITS